VDATERAKVAAVDATERAKVAAAGAAGRAKETAQHIAVDRVGPALAPVKERAQALDERSRVLPIAAAALAAAGAIVLVARRRR